MKALLFIVSFCIVTASFAGEVETDCIAMDEVTKEKNVRTVKPKPNSGKGATSQ